jgi:UDP-N-acetyl-D-glucosamine dehydrogenase
MNRVSSQVVAISKEVRKELAADDKLFAFCSKLQNKTAQIGIIGLGYVGLPLALLFSRKGFRTSGFDIDPGKVEKLRRGESYINHIPGKIVTEQIEPGRFQPRTDFAGLREMDAIIICVPTPLNKHHEPDLSLVRNTTTQVGVHLQPGQLVVLESTSYPGTTDEELLPILEQSGLHCPASSYATDGREVTCAEASDPEFFLAFSPEREDPGNKQFQNHQIPKVVGGVNGPSALAARALYQSAFDRTLMVSPSRAAEMTKLLENIYRCVNIALVNELKLLSMRMGIDIWEVIEAAKSKPFGFSPFYPGPGLGGHCIPIDPFYLTWKAREYDFPTRFIELAGETNTAMPYHVVNAVMEALSRQGKPIYGSKVLILGVAYKKDIDDVRESPAMKIMELLDAKGSVVAYHDPFVPRLGPMRKYNFALESVALTPEALRAYDCALIVTDHGAIDYDEVVRESSLVIDTRNATAGVRNHSEKIVRC